MSSINAGEQEGFERAEIVRADYYELDKRVRQLEAQVELLLHRFERHERGRPSPEQKGHRAAFERDG